MRVASEDCVHYEACRRCQDKSMRESVKGFLLLECWDCQLYVSRCSLMECIMQTLQASARVWQTLEEAGRQKQAGKLSEYEGVEF